MNNSPGVIRRANLNGTNIETLVHGVHSPEGIALDVAGGKMYWTEDYVFNPDVIRCANLNGANIKTLVSGLDHPNSIALDVAGGKIYWTENTSNRQGAIKRANLNGTNIETLVSGVDRPSSIALGISWARDIPAPIPLQSLSSYLCQHLSSLYLHQGLPKLCQYQMST